MYIPTKSIILASNSPRRHDLLKLLHIPFSIHAVETDELIDEIDPANLVQSLARQKAKASWLDYRKDALYIGADTVVVLNQQIFGKPIDLSEAKRMIQQLQGNKHQVFTGICLFDSATQIATTDFVQTDVFVDSMTNDEINAYIALEQPLDKAGAYGIQGAFAAFVSRIDGCYYNIMGLPISKLYNMLQSC